MERVHQYPVVKKLREKMNRWFKKNIDPVGKTSPNDSM
jgi:hypothetical protein